MEISNPKDQIPNKSQVPNNKWALVNLAFELGFVIALPVVAFGFLGKWLDAKVGNETPWFTLFGIVLAITSTTFWLAKRLKQYIK